MRPLAFAILSILAAAAHANEPNSLQLTRSLNQRIQLYHHGQKNNAECLRIVYFTPADADPPQYYQQRVSRIVLDIKKFYDQQMQRNGFAGRNLPLEMQDQLVKIHTVKGKEPANAYDYEYKHGKKIFAEIKKALAPNINPDHDFLLILCNLCDKRDDGSFFFHSPYYGGPGSNQIRGYCFAADCPLQDPQLLTDTQNHIIYAEHYGQFTQSLADFNTKYLGGIAHELGHGLSLPHNAQPPHQTKTLGHALMGDGNHSYRRELWHNSKSGAFMTPASCLRLATHPLFTQSDRERFIEPNLDILDLQFAAQGHLLHIQGHVQAHPEVLAVIAYTDPEKIEDDPNPWTDYDAIAHIAPVTQGRFHLSAPHYQPGHHKLRLTFLHQPGQTSSTPNLKYQTNQNHHPDPTTLTTQWQQQHQPLSR